MKEINSLGLLIGLLFLGAAITLLTTNTQSTAVNQPYALIIDGEPTEHTLYVCQHDENCMDIYDVNEIFGN